MWRGFASQEGVDQVAVRGSSLGGFLRSTQLRVPGDRRRGRDLPAGEDHLASGLRRGSLEMRVGDPAALEAWLLAQDIGEAVARIAPRPLLLMHAEGDTQIPSDHSEELFERAGKPRKLIIVPGGAHRTVQHDSELQGAALRWVERELGPASPGAGS
jgi:fermentation-respiration switch protein FrsA (DUF1100 family)